MNAPSTHRTSRTKWSIQITRPSAAQRLTAAAAPAPKAEENVLEYCRGRNGCGGNLIRNCCSVWRPHFDVEKYQHITNIWFHFSHCQVLIVLFSWRVSRIEMQAVCRAQLGLRSRASGLKVTRRRPIHVELSWRRANLRLPPTMDS